MTPLFLALIMIEFVDLIFAIDSVPAILRSPLILLLCIRLISLPY